MSKKETEQVSLDDLNYFWMSNGAPCFIANRPDICEVVESLGFQIYYLITNIEEEKTVDGKDNQNKPVKYIVSELRSSLVKVVNNLIGRCVSEAEDALPIEMYSSVKEEAYYNMPKIPKSIVDKLDEFFRLVHAQHGTESIVILTFDPTKNDSSGWGVLVPEQTNTSVHCKYDADSIVSLKPEDVLIVGSVHSHPDMPAYASGTDHADQADFDGIHITYGWQKSVNGGATQYHAEMQLGGSNYKLDIEDVIDVEHVIKDPDPEVVEWTNKVKKVYPPSLHKATGDSASRVTPVPSTQHNPSREYTQVTTTEFVPIREKNIPFQFDSTNGYIVAEVEFTDKDPRCPSCNYQLFEQDAEEEGSCPSCDIAIASASWSMDMIETSALKHISKRNQDVTSAIYLWCRDNQSNSPNHFLIQIKADDLDSRPSIGKKYDVKDFTDEEYLESTYDIEELYFGTSSYNKDVTLCCRCDADRAWVECKCSSTIYYEDLDIFETTFKDLDLYIVNSGCEDCAFAYSPDCPAYRQNIIDYFQSGVVPQENSVDICDSWVDFNKVAADIDSFEGGYHYDRD